MRAGPVTDPDHFIAAFVNFKRGVLAALLYRLSVHSACGSGRRQRLLVRYGTDGRLYDWLKALALFAARWQTDAQRCPRGAGKSALQMVYFSLSGLIELGNPLARG